MKILKIPKTLSLNKYRNTNPFTLNDLKQQYTVLVRFAMQESGVFKRELKTPIKTIFYFANYQGRDLDGEAISIKNFHDALTDMGMIPDDNRKYLKSYEVVELEEKGNYYHVEIIEDYKIENSKI